jgi:glutamyl-tRNA reductase
LIFVEKVEICTLKGKTVRLSDNFMTIVSIPYEYFCVYKVRMKQSINTYKIITLTHHHAKLQDIGRYVLESNEALAGKLHIVKSDLGLDELMYLATCNRIMFFVSTPKKIEKSFIGELLFALHGHIPKEHLEAAAGAFNIYEGRDAVRHLFEVASSIDSLVVGEREILRQIRESYENCLKVKLTGDSIRLAMRFAIEGAKGVYSHTRIGDKPISVVSLAIKELLGKNPSFDSKILLVGAGQTNTLLGKLLLGKGFTNFTVFNRTLEFAEKLGKKISAKGHQLSELSNYSGGFDILIVCTGATEPIINAEIFKNLLNGDNSKKIIIDLSVPRNVSPAVIEIPIVTYIEIESLREKATQNMSFRQLEVEKAKEILDEKLLEFEAAFRARLIERALKNVPQQVKAIKERAMNDIFKDEVDALDTTSRDLLERMLTYMEKGCISLPMKTAKEALLNQ